MKIVLTTPYSVGDLSPDTTYPHVYITTFYVNGPARNITISYEYGTLDAPTDDNPMGLWHPSPYVPQNTMTIQDASIYPFFTSSAVASPPSLWDQVETLLYQQIQAQDARTAGSLE